MHIGKFDVLGFQYDLFNPIPYDVDLRCIVSESEKVLHLKSQNRGE